MLTRFSTDTQTIGVPYRLARMLIYTDNAHWIEAWYNQRQESHGSHCVVDVNWQCNGSIKIQC